MSNEPKEITDDEAIAFLIDLNALTEKHGLILCGETGALYLAGKGIKRNSTNEYTPRGPVSGGGYEFYYGGVSDER